ncbi:DNA polymerase [Lactococcus lactis]|uniref:DNA-directed DNA polymerase n=1 Tax=Lactococcus lactis TaxID=1358 RepID=A0AAP3Z0Z2_9LACT|nr:DNA polymerase [Lactococcus lactis]MDG4968268.1 DNA polymerase [Lactococcus lactis]MDG4976372.1 DNA polymerase [Lactococcus lactis]MDG5102176.1 DNA polymerase [Lactococcus lactis]
MKLLRLDLETRSDNEIKFGVHKYVDSDRFKILLLAYSIDGEEPEIVDLAKGEIIPIEIQQGLVDPNIKKAAFNASFEMTCLKKHLGQYLPPEQWYDEMIHGMELGLPASLEQMAKYLKVSQQKDTEGKRLIRKFCIPKKDGSFCEEFDSKDWELFKSYCIQDVKAEGAIADKLEAYPIAESEWELWYLDRRINDRGIGVDMDLVHAALSLDEETSVLAKEKLQELTGLDNPNSVMQLKKWLSEQGLEVASLGKEQVTEILEDSQTPQIVCDALLLRQATSNASIKKYDMLDNATCSDERIHGILQFYGASRTGRWAGRLLQVQNLPRGSLKPNELADARDFVKNKDIEALDMIWGDVPNILKSLIRSSLIPSEGNEFIVSDFSAIEARVIAWLAGEEWVLDTFRTGHDIYKATANQMFNLGGVDKVDKSMRQRGKVATLALGYQGGTGALKAMGALKMGIEEDELQGLVNAWRKANPNIVRFWKRVEAAAKRALEFGTKVSLRGTGISFYVQDRFLMIELPNGRSIAYTNARLEEGRIRYEGKSMASSTFQTLDTYGGKLVENIVQATARDVLGESMIRLEKLGYKIVAHVHDEVILDVPKGASNIDEINKLMAINPEWTEGLPLAAAGFRSDFYMKD